MKIIDLTHTIKEDMPVYPGTNPPSLSVANTYKNGGFKETLISMYSHTGTHIDPPAHIFEGKMTLDAFDASQFVGSAVVIDCRMLKEGEEISLEHIKSYGEKAERADFLLFNLGWDKKWGTPDYFGSYPCLSSDSLDYIINGNYKGIGFDVIGLDPINDLALERHNKLFSKKNIINIENLKNLDLCGSELFTFVCLPIKIENSDGAPSRAIAIV
ncbi:MAG: cyclase family protein [Clostridia bacterium]|nr:cyclase family protein [Clostridia bacterium]